MSDHINNDIEEGRIACDCCHDENGDVMIQSHDLLGYRDLWYQRRIIGPGLAEKVRFLRRVRHENFVRVLAMVPRADPDIIDVHFELMPIVAVNLTANVFPHFNELALAAILGQVSS